MTDDPRRWWDRLGRGQRVAAVLVGAAVALNLALAAAESVVGESPGGPASSAYSTGGSGLEGYADLLAAEGHTVVRLQDRPTADDLPPAATVVLADPAGFGPADARRIAGFISAGGRLVVAGEQGAPLVAALAEHPVTWTDEEPADELEVWLPVDGTGSASRLVGDAGGRWIDPGPLLPVAGAEGVPSVVVGTVGQGRLIALADAAVLQNANLDQGDNAALALAAAGPPDRPVVFVESLARAGGEGMAAVPPAWKWVAAGLAAALVTGLWSAGARFGPPEPDRRALRPPRRDHVDAVAANLDRATRRSSHPDDSPGATP